MNEINLREVLAQASDNEAVELLQQTLRQSVRMPLALSMQQKRRKTSSHPRSRKSH